MHYLIRKMEFLFEIRTKVGATLNERNCGSIFIKFDGCFPWAGGTKECCFQNKLTSNFSCQIYLQSI